MKSGYEAPIMAVDPVGGDGDVFCPTGVCQEESVAPLHTSPNQRHSLAPVSVRYSCREREMTTRRQSLPTSKAIEPLLEGCHFEEEPGLLQWCNRDAPTLPHSHPLDPISIFIPSTTSRIVASRISIALRNLSIEANYAPPDEYDAEQLHQANCRTIEGVDFRIFLYRGRGTKYAHGTIVEIVRWYGSSYDFHVVTRSIFAAAKDQPVKPYQRKRRRTYPALPLPEDTEPVGVEDRKKSAIAFDHQSSLKFISKLIRTNHELALQMLVSLTDPTHDGIESARRYCQLVTRNTSMMVKIIRLLSAHSLLTLRLLVHVTPYFDRCLQCLVRPAIVAFLKEATNQSQQQAYLAVQCIIEPKQEDYPILLQVAKMAEDQHLGLYEEVIEKLIKLL